MSVMLPHYQRVLDLLGAVPRGGRFWKAKCPKHKGGCERTPSLSIWITPSGKLALRCYVCGDAANAEILSLLGLEFPIMFPDFEDDPKNKPHSRKRLPAKVYTYTDELGQPLHRTLRFEFDDPEARKEKGKNPKSFAQERFDRESGKWLAGLGTFEQCRRVLYRLPHLLGNPDKPVLIAEGEGKVDLLISWGVVATCAVGGTGMGGASAAWLPEYSKTLSGRTVLLLPDNDDCGRRHMAGVAGHLLLSGTCDQIGFVDYPAPPGGGDIVDLARAGFTRDDLWRCVNKAKLWTPRAD